MAGQHRPGAAGARVVLSVVVLGLLGGAGYVFREPLLRLVGAGDDGGGAPSPPAESPAPSVSPSPTPSPDPSPSPEPVRRRRLVIHGTGDVNLDTSYIPNLASQGFEYAWSGLEGLFERDDLTVINLECAASELGEAVPKEFNFRCPHGYEEARAAGVEVANLGNNHAGDYGPEALVDSRRTLRKAGIAPVGAGRNERQATKPDIFEIKGWKIAVLGFGGVVPEPGWIAGPDHPGMADGDDIGKMVAAVEAADRVADLVFVSIHWGVELDTEPRQEDVDRAEAMIDAGADGIFGHHAHRLQPMGRYRGRPIAWGLGNFVWPNFSSAGSTTAVAEIVVTPKGKVKGRLLPAHIADAGHPVLR